MTAQQQLRLVADSWEIGEWLQREETKAAILDYVPLATPGVLPSVDGVLTDTSLCGRYVHAREVHTVLPLQKRHPARSSFNAFVALFTDLPASLSML